MASDNAIRVASKSWKKRLCRLLCGKPLAFRGRAPPFSPSARLEGSAFQPSRGDQSGQNPGKAKPFRTAGGRAALNRYLSGTLTRAWGQPLWLPQGGHKGRPYAAIFSQLLSFGRECSGGFTPPPRKWWHKAAATGPRLRHYTLRHFSIDEWNSTVYFRSVHSGQISLEH